MNYRAFFMYHFSIEHISRLTGAQIHSVIPAPDTQQFIAEIAYDSRKIIQGAHTLFIALHTEAGNGHRYISEAYRKGVRVFFVSEAQVLSNYPNAIFLEVKNTLQALQQFARQHRENFKGKVLAITGSNGKTTIKEWLQFLLSNNFRIKSSPGSYNSSLGIPLSLLLLNESDEYGIIEAGISKPGEMEAAEDWIKPDIGIISTIATAHLENFSSQYEIAGEKLKLFKNVRYFICHIDAVILSDAIHALPSLSEKAVSWKWETPFDADYDIHIQTENGNHSILHIKDKKENTVQIEVPFSDRASLENACHCALFCIKENLLNEDVKARFKQLKPVDMRLQMAAGINNCTILNDSYTADLSSLRIALEALSLLPGLKTRSLILTDLRLHGHIENQVYTDAASLVNSYLLDKVILIGEEIGRYKNAFNGEVFTYKNTINFLTHFQFSKFQQEAILIKGTREFQPEKIVAFLEQKRHETVLEINLDALAHNVQYFRQEAGSGVKLMAMVKAFSYGTGSVEIANQLRFRNVDYLAVAYTDEGAELRRAGIDIPIMVMNPGKPSVNMLLEHRLEPEIFSFRSLRYFTEEIQYRTDSQPLSVHLKMDTGMHRLGFSPQEIIDAVDEIGLNPKIKIASVFSHLVSAEDLEDADFTRKQIQIFTETADKIRQKTGYDFIRHIGNSAAISNFPEARLDMVRLGIGMYGISSNPQTRQKLKPVLRFKTTVTQIRSVPAGETVGYNRAGKVERDSLIATIPVGYADGFRRAMGLGRGSVYIGGNLYPVIGKVCMDMSMIDITGSTIQEGDEVLLFGAEHPVEKMAEVCGTISYEMLTGISPRVKRIYLTE